MDRKQCQLGFYSILVRLKAIPVFIDTLGDAVVSIPYWFD